MIKFMRALTKIFLCMLAIPVSACMLWVLLFVWSPFILLASLIYNAQAFATKRDEYFNPLNEILWFFWDFVMFNTKKADKYLL